MEVNDLSVVVISIIIFIVWCLGWIGYWRMDK